MKPDKVLAVIFCALTLIVASQPIVPPPLPLLKVAVGDTEDHASLSVDAPARSHVDAGVTPNRSVAEVVDPGIKIAADC